MNAGRVQQVDSPLALYDRPANRFVAGFIGSPAMNFVEGSVSNDGGSRSFVSADGTIAIPLPDSVVSSAGANTAVVFGIRPEDVEVGVGESRPGSVAARVDLVEPLGNETFVHASVGGLVVTARCAGRDLPVSGSLVSLRLDPHKAHWFDAETGLSLRASSRESASRPVRETAGGQDGQD